MIARVAYPAWMLLAVAPSLALGEPRICAAAGALGLGQRFARARGWRTASGKVASANLVTTARLAVVVALPALAAHAPRAATGFVVFALLCADGLDGYLARTRGEASRFGADYDMETDALCVMVVALLLHRGGLGAWVLVAGLWRYGFAAAEALVPALGDCPPSPIYRWIFTALMIALALAWLPIGPLAAAAAAAGTALVSFSFLHSIARSRAFAGVTGAARRAGTPSSSDRT